MVSSPASPSMLSATAVPVRVSLPAVAPEIEFRLLPVMGGLPVPCRISRIAEGKLNWLKLIGLNRASLKLNWNSAPFVAKLRFGVLTVSTVPVPLVSKPSILPSLSR